MEPIDGDLVTVVGVLPPGAELPNREAELWLPVGKVEERFGPFGREEREFTVLGRLAAGVGVASAQNGSERSGCSSRWEPAVIRS